MKKSVAEVYIDLGGGGVPRVPARLFIGLRFPFSHDQSNHFLGGIYKPPPLTRASEMQGCTSAVQHVSPSDPLPCLLRLVHFFDVLVVARYSNRVLISVLDRAFSSNTMCLVSMGARLTPEDCTLRA